MKGQVFILFAINFRAFLSSPLTCEFEEYELCLIKNQEVSATEPFEIYRSNGVPFTDIILIVKDLPTLPTTIFTNNPNATFFSLQSDNLNQISFKVFANARKLMKLYISYGQLKRIVNGTFRNCENLEDLEILNHQISFIGANAFKGLSNLKVLSLADNLIGNLHPRLFEPLLNLALLMLDSNRLQRLDARTFQWNLKLIQVEMNSNDLTNLPPDLFSQNRNLTSLYLNGNKLESSSTFGVAEVFLSSNQLRSIQIASGLVKLIVENNFIETIDCTDADLSTVETVMASNNSISSYDCIRDMANIDLLELQFNKLLRPAPDIFTTLTNLTILRTHGQSRYSKVAAKIFAPLKSLQSLSVDRLLEYRNLRQLFPEMYMISVVTNSWNCTYTQQVVNTLKRQSIRMNYVRPSDRTICNIVQN